MPRKIVNPRIQGQSLPPEITQGQMIQQQKKVKSPTPRIDFTDQKRVNPVYRWK